MTSSLFQRLESWRAILRDGRPTWLVRLAPKIIAEIEAMIAAQGMPLEEPRREGGSGASAPASPVGETDAPNPSPNLSPGDCDDR